MLLLVQTSTLACTQCSVNAHCCTVHTASRLPALHTPTRSTRQLADAMTVQLQLITPRHRLWSQVTHVEMDNEVATLKMAEMLVGRVNLKYQDKKTGDIKDEGATKPEVIMRQLCTKVGQVSFTSHSLSTWGWQMCIDVYGSCRGPA